MEKKVHCPFCRQRLFDVKGKEFVLEIKCMRCAQIVRVEV